jgi:oxygen-independent coproporphyrinogen III oxidase
LETLGLYIHFPFCIKKCNYCDFPSYDGKQSLMKAYLDALIKEISHLAFVLDGYKVDTIFMGGGTPTIFSGEDIQKVLDACYLYMDIDNGAEMTIEANPGTLDDEKLYRLKRGGINRLSIGLQAWQDRHLKALGRVHTCQDFIDSIYMARKYGFKNINADIIFNLPNQTMDDWIETIEGICGLGLEHVSAYSLRVEEHTPFYSMQKQGRLLLPKEELERDMYHKGIKVLSDKGFKHYEISNFALPGRECRHNLIYWQNHQYIGCGSGAHSFFKGKRFANTRYPESYIQLIAKGKSPVVFSEDIGKKTERFETVMLGLRLVDGIDKNLFKSRFNHDFEFYYADAMERLKKQGLLVEDKYRIKLTSKGLDLQNTVLMEFMD